MDRYKLTGKEKILIVRHDRLGDLVLTLPMAQVLKDMYPELQIDFLVSEYNHQLLKYSDSIDGYITADTVNNIPKGMPELINELNAAKYDIVIFARPDLYTTFTAFMADIDLRLGTARRAYSFLYNIRVEISRRFAGIHELDLNLKLLEPLGITIKPGSIDPILKIPEGVNEMPSRLHDLKHYVVVHSGSKGSSPNWPEVYYAALIEKISKHYMVILTGQGKAVIDESNSIINYIDRTNFDQLVNILANADLFISGSTGPLHIAAALGTPVIGLYPDHPVLGPHRWGPRGKRTTVFAPLKHSGHKCRINNNGTCDCMELITVEEVYDRAIEILNSEA